MSFFRQDRIDTLERSGGGRALFLPLLFVAGIWLLYLANLSYGWELKAWGINPGNFRGPEFLLAPLLHGDLEHLFANSVPLVVLGAAVLYLYPRAAWPVFALTYFGTSVLVYFIARGGNHIGASGINYGLVCFIFFSGLLRREPPAIALSLLVTFLYGSMVWGVLPRDPNISWEAHLSGSLVGIAYAVVHLIRHPPVRVEMQDDDEYEYGTHDDGDWADYPHPDQASQSGSRGDYFQGGRTPRPYRNPYRDRDRGLDVDDY